MLLIGSAALGRHIDGYRTPVDYDYIGTIEEYHDTVSYFKTLGWLKAAYPISANSMVIKTENEGIRHIYEFSIAWPGNSNEDILKHNEKYNAGRDIASLDMLYMIKLSHRFKKNSVHFRKTMADIRSMRELDVNVSKSLKKILKKREKETYTYAHPNLSQNKNQFFQERESFYVYEHDDIHVAVATEDSPAYTQFSMDGEEVRVDKDKWDALPLRTKLLAGLEESYVLALERSLVPHPGVLTPKQAFDKALEKVCTSITSGWFREFCWEHYHEIQALYDESFVSKFEAALAAGRIRKFNEQS